MLHYTNQSPLILPFVLFVSWYTVFFMSQSIDMRHGESKYDISQTLRKYDRFILYIFQVWLHMLNRQICTVVVKIYSINAIYVLKTKKSTE